jgi:CRISPR-associated endonuclease/helicase Cas3
MMVTFVSQCEKKALGRTRRVLDAFANRIGDNTWQTIITEDGLITAKKLLRQTATKNTAVSCHWLRSRSRSELVWIVGNRDKFNSQGIVPVNITQKELFMDILSDKPKSGVLYANTKLQPLTEHLFAVGYVAEKLYEKLLPEKTNHIHTAFIAGCLHDLGKIDPHFQSWVIDPKKKDYVAEDGQHIDDKKFSFEDHPRHNEISVLLYHLLDHDTLQEVNQANKESVKRAIYWHHAKPFRKESKGGGFDKYSEIYSKLCNNLSSSFEELLRQSIRLLENVSKIDSKYKQVSESFLDKVFLKEIDQTAIEALGYESKGKLLPLPSYKVYEYVENLEKYQPQITNNANNNILRSCVISADRLISALSASDLQTSIQDKKLDDLVEDHLSIIKDSNLCSQIETSLKSFTDQERNKKQSEIAHRLFDKKDIAILAGPAGCGKTKIALEWASLKNAKQIIWICPRVQICQGLFDDLTSNQYLPDTRIEINTGEFKFTNKWDKQTPEKEYFSGDIVITTIDQILNSIITHTKVDKLINYLNAHIVFDEFHEYINMPAFNLLFAELVECKKEQGKMANTLLVSATPHYFYLDKILKIRSDEVVAMPSFNQSKYKIEFKIFDETKQDDSNPLYQKQSGKTFVISNTAITAQKSFIRNLKDENAILFHSKFKKSDKRKLFNDVYESFKQGAENQYDVLRSGPIVQASLNISCDHMISEITTPENSLQRLGRLDRFGKNKEVNIYCLAAPESIHQGKVIGSCAKFLAKTFEFDTTKEWYKFLQSELGDKPFELSWLYELYEKFHNKSDNARKFIESDLIGSFKSSVKLIDCKVIDPIVIPSKKAIPKGRAKISKNSLRGENRFVQMAVVNMNNPNQPEFLEQYAYQMPINEREDFDNLTASKDEIEGYGDSEKNLLAHMQKKHHNVFKDKGAKKSYKDFILLNEARDPESPIYLSYTPNDLLGVGGESARHNCAIYYAVCDKQTIGAISIKQLNSNEE